MTYRACLLASTMMNKLPDRHARASHGMQSATDAGDRFMASAHIAQRYRFVTPEKLKPAFQQFCSDLGIHDPASIEVLSQQKIHESTLAHFLETRHRMVPKPGLDAVGEAMRRFFAAQAMMDLLEGSLEASTSFPPLVKRVLKDGAEGLFKLGRPQFVRLAKLACELTGWLITRGHKTVTLVEAPLGNTVPVAVMREVAHLRGMNARIVEWGCPRNDRPSKGMTVRDSAKALATLPDVSDAEIVLFVDDALTGSRFRKMAGELRRMVGNDRVAVVAVRFRFHSGTGAKPFNVRDMGTVESWAEVMSLPQGVVDFPALPTFNIDKHGSVYLASAMAWGDVDLVAGKRKTNLVFHLVERFEAIALRLAEPDGECRRFLERELWSRDVRGREFVCTPGLINQVFSRIFEEAPVADLFQKVRASARAAFPDDYLGRRFEFNEAQVRRRSDWLRTCIFEAAHGQIDESRAWVLSRAITDIHDAGLTGGKDKPSRDHDYGQYTIPWNPDLQTFHHHLVELVTVEARCAV